MPLIGIANENEFYSDYYLYAIFQDDLKGIAKTWGEKGLEPADRRLKSLRKNYFQSRENLAQAEENTEKLGIQREFSQQLLAMLGYEWQPSQRWVIGKGEMVIPVLGEIKDHLWIVEAFNPAKEALDVLSQPLWAEQGLDEKEELPVGEVWEDLINDGIFGQDQPPRWVMVVGFEQIVLIDRHKWGSSRLLRFDLDKIFDENDGESYLATAMLLHRDHLCPLEGTAWLDTLDENSHRHTYGVSESLKFALREAIELLGNEAVWYWGEVKKKRVYASDEQQELGEQEFNPNVLKTECLRWVYRLLFIFYIEARPELGFAPINSEVYRLGYSLESLRDLEKVEFTTLEGEQGYFLDISIRQLFELFWEGFPPKETQGTLDLSTSINANRQDSDDIYDTFRLPDLKSHLFDPDRTDTYLNKVQFRNGVLRRVIELMSLSDPNRGKEGKGKRRQRGRISYAQLGVNQLGEVYEGLLSLSAFFAEEDLYEVKPAEDKEERDLEVAYFVGESRLDEFKPDEYVLDRETGRPKLSKKGTFLFRLAGRDRQKSASYYTLQSLTQCLVKYALKELLQEKTANQILGLKVCEPAMGSAAFLNEVIDQLADAYLERKQQELNDRIPYDRLTVERQKIKMFIADRKGVASS